VSGPSALVEMSNHMRAGGRNRRARSFTEERKVEHHFSEHRYPGSIMVLVCRVIVGRSNGTESWNDGRENNYSARTPIPESDSAGPSGLRVVRFRGITLMQPSRIQWPALHNPLPCFWVYLLSTCNVRL